MVKIYTVSYEFALKEFVEWQAAGKSWVITVTLRTDLGKSTFDFQSLAKEPSIKLSRAFMDTAKGLLNS